MIQIMQANISHIADIYTLEQQLFGEGAYGLQSLNEELTNPNRIYLVALENGAQVIGYLGANVTSDFAEIMKIGVTGSEQRQGVATQLLQDLEKKLSDKGVHKLQLEVKSTNQKAILFYEKMGFVNYYVRKNYYKTCDALLYEKTV